MKRTPYSSAPAEPAPLTALYQRWRKPLVRLLQGRFGTRADAEDATQQVFTQMAASGKRPEAGKEPAYLSRSARHLAIDDWRRSGKILAIDTVSIDAADEEAGALAAGDEHDSALRAEHRQRLARLDEALMRSTAGASRAA
ncbi:MAG: sigma factor [Comamonas sp.]